MSDSDFGVGRVVDPAGALPQQARVLDPSLPPRSGEIAIDVDYLNVDAASWYQIRRACDGDAERMKAHLMELVGRAGKLHNPVTGSGGMLVGRVSGLGADRSDPAVGTRIASLVSLTLTPLLLDDILELDPDSEKVKVRGTALLLPTGNYAVLPAPEDLDERAALGVLDVCGAPAWVARLAQPGDKVVVIGAGGKSGMLACAQAVRNVGDEGRVLGLCWPEDSAVPAKDAGAEAIVVDCTDAVAAYDAVRTSLDSLADLVFVCANVPGCEGAAILACSDEGRVVFFSMATSFSAAALIAEGLGKSCELTIGNGYVPGHADLALELVRDNPALEQWFVR